MLIISSIIHILFCRTKNAYALKILNNFIINRYIYIYIYSIFQAFVMILVKKYLITLQI